MDLFLSIICWNFVFIHFCIHVLQASRVPITPHTFKRLVLEVPADVMEFAKRPDVLGDFQERTHARVSRVDDKTHAYIILSRDDTILKRAKMLADLFFRSVKQKFVLISRREDSLRRMAETNQVRESGFSLVFNEYFQLSSWQFSIF